MPCDRMPIPASHCELHQAQVSPLGHLASLEVASSDPGGTAYYRLNWVQGDFLNSKQGVSSSQPPIARVPFASR